MTSPLSAWGFRDRRSDIIMITLLLLNFYFLVNVNQIISPLKAGWEASLFDGPLVVEIL